MTPARRLEFVTTSWRVRVWRTHDGYVAIPMGGCSRGIIGYAPGAISRVATFATTAAEAATNARRILLAYIEHKKPELGYYVVDGYTHRACSLSTELAFYQDQINSTARSKFGPDVHAANHEPPPKYDPAEVWYWAVTPHDTNPLPHPATGVWAENAGVIGSDGDTFPVGPDAIVPLLFPFDRIQATGTTATGIVAIIGGW